MQVASPKQPLKSGGQAGLTEAECEGRLVCKRDMALKPDRREADRSRLLVQSITCCKQRTSVQDPELMVMLGMVM